MAIKTRQELLDYWNTNIIQNNKQLITGAVMNEAGTDIIDSMSVQPGQITVDGDFTVDVNYDNSVVVWGSGNNNNAVCTLPQGMTEGFQFKILNVSTDYVLTFTGAGVILPPATTVAPRESVWVYFTGNVWYTMLFDSYKVTEGWGTISSVGATNLSVTPNTWTSIHPSSTVLSVNRNMSLSDYTLRIVTGSGGTDSTVMEIYGAITFTANKARDIYLSFGGSGTSAYPNTEESAAKYTANEDILDTKVSLNFFTVVEGIDGDHIYLKVKSSTGDPVYITKYNLTIKYKTI